MKNEELLWNFFVELKRQLTNEEFVVDKTGVKLVEVINANIKGLNPTQKQLNFGSRKTPLKYVEKESLWYNSKDLNIKSWVDDIEIWKSVADKNGFINSNYGWCIFSAENHKQYLNCLNTLLEHPQSRRACMIYNRPSMQYEYKRDGMNDFICTFNTQQLIRNNKLIYIVTQRSQDAIYGLFNDLAWHQEVYIKLFEDLKQKMPELEVGYIDLNIASFHVYERHFPMLASMELVNE